MPKRLNELEPVITAAGFLMFDCPVCEGDKAHRVRVPLAPVKDHNGRSWGHTGDLSDLTLHNARTPENPEGLSSVNIGCWHGHIINGVITP